MQNMIVVGLTGPTGAGKTTVSRYIEAAGIPVVDADRAAREVVLPGTRGLARISEEFGETVLCADGTLNRAALGNIVFSDARKKNVLEHILYPEILALIDRRLARLEQAGERIAVLDAPTLFESGADKGCDYVLVVTAPRGQRLARIIERDGLSEPAALARMSAQQPEAFYERRADFVVRNADTGISYGPVLDWLSGLEKPVKKQQ